MATHTVGHDEQLLIAHDGEAVLVVVALKTNVADPSSRCTELRHTRDSRNLPVVTRRSQDQRDPAKKRDCWRN
jgi:hypothetical protein